MDVTKGLPIYMFLIVIAIGLFIYIGFRLYRKIILPVILLKDDGVVRQKIFIKIEIVVWAMFFMVAVYFSLKASMVITLILLLLILLAFFDFFRNFFPGIAIKFGDNFQIGDDITINDIHGRVSNFGFRSLKLVTAKGEEILMPYRLINTSVKIEQKSTPKVLFKSMTIQDDQERPIDFKERIKNAICVNPWIIMSNPINISITDNIATLDFYTLNNDLFEKARQKLIKDLNQN